MITEALPKHKSVQTINQTPSKQLNNSRKLNLLLNVKQKNLHPDNLSPNLTHHQIKYSLQTF